MSSHDSSRTRSSTVKKKKQLTEDELHYKLQRTNKIVLILFTVIFIISLILTLIIGCTYSESVAYISIMQTILIGVTATLYYKYTTY